MISKERIEQIRTMTSLAREGSFDRLTYKPITHDEMDELLHVYRAAQRAEPQPAAAALAKLREALHSRSRAINEVDVALEGAALVRIAAAARELMNAQPATAHTQDVSASEDLPNDERIRDQARHAAGPNSKWQGGWTSEHRAERATFLEGFMEGARWMRLEAHRADESCRDGNEVKPATEAQPVTVTGGERHSCYCFHCGSPVDPDRSPGTVWLVERTSGNGVPCWYNDGRYNDGVRYWTVEATKATRYDWAVAAAQVARQLREKNNDSTIREREHMFIPPEEPMARVEARTGEPVVDAEVEARDQQGDTVNRTEHLLWILAEECAEVAQRASKMARFGLYEVQPGQGETNRERLTGECCDVVAAIEMLVRDGSIEKPDFARIDAKMKKVEHYLRYSAECGTLDQPATSQSPRRDVPERGERRG